MYAAIKNILSYHSTWTVLLSPLLIMILPLMVPGQESLCAFVLILMAVYWVTECIPLAVTAMLPLVLFPLLGLMKGSAVSVLYFKDTNWLLVGGLTIAAAVELTNLHKRIALKVLLIVGAKPRSLMAGFMATTFFLSMWISNTATTAMMLPIVEAIFTELNSTRKASKGKTQDGDQNGSDNFAFTNETFSDNEDIHGNIDEEDVTQKRDDDVKITDVKEDVDDSAESTEVVVTFDAIDKNATKDDKTFMRIWKGVTISIPYAASIGGTATLTGTAPNLIVSGQFELLFPEADQNLSFGVWFVYCFPQALCIVILVYIWLSLYFIGFNRNDFRCSSSGKSESEIRAENVIKTEYNKLGNINWAEITVLCVFICTALLWFFRDPGFIAGWGSWFSDGYVTDGTVAVTMATILFFLPSEKPMFLQRPRQRLMHPVKPVLSWPIVQKKIAWDVCLLLGGGFALAEASTSSGLSAWIAGQLIFLDGLADWLICLIVTAIVCFFTECTSNTATASLFVPILAQLSQAIGVHPIYMMVPPIVAASLAFMLPVATPPNAVAFSYGHLKVIDMIKSGWLANVIGILVLTLFINTYGVAYFGLDGFPEWAMLQNDTTIVVTTLSPSINCTSIS